MEGVGHEVSNRFLPRHRRQTFGASTGKDEGRGHNELDLPSPPLTSQRRQTWLGRQWDLGHIKVERDLRQFFTGRDLPG